MLLWSLLAATASAAPSADDAFGVNFAGGPINGISIDVSNVKQCGNAVISWTGTQGDVEVTIGTGGYYVGSTTLDTLSGLQGSSTTWKVNVPAGSDTLIFQVKDSTGDFKYKQGVPVESSSDSSCLSGGSSSSSPSSASPAPSSSPEPEPSTTSTASKSSSKPAPSSSTPDGESSASTPAPSSEAPPPSTSKEPTPPSKSPTPEPVPSSDAGASPTSSDEVSSSSSAVSITPPSSTLGTSGVGSGSSGDPSSGSSSETSSDSPASNGGKSTVPETSSSRTSSDVSTAGAETASSAAPVSESSVSNSAAQPSSQQSSQHIDENTPAPSQKPTVQEPKTKTEVVPAPPPQSVASGAKSPDSVVQPSSAVAVVTDTISSTIPNSASQPAQAVQSSVAPVSSSPSSRSVVYVTSLRTPSSEGAATETATVVGDSKGASLSLQNGASRTVAGPTAVFAAALAVLAAAVL